MKKILAMASAALAITMAFTGCSESILTSSGDTTSVENIWTAQDDDIIAWATGADLSEEDKEYYNIKFKDFYSEYAFTITNYGLDETSSDYETYAKYYRQNIIDMLSNEKIILRKAKEYGLDTLTEEEMNEIDTSYQEILGKWYENFKSDAEEALGITSDGTSGGDSANDEKILEKEKELFGAYIGQFGLTEEILLTWQTNTFIEKKVLEYVYKDITVTDEEIDEYINNLINEAKSKYESDVSSFETNNAYQSVWLPEGSREIKYIYLGLSSADAAELTAAREESGADDAEIDKQRDEKLAEIKEKAEAALEKATAEGADFDAVIKEYSNDYSEAYAGQPTLIIKGSQALHSSLYDAIYSLEKVGDISGLIATDKGYYIIKYTGDAQISEEDLNKVKETEKSSMLSERQNETANNTIVEWRKQVGYDYDYDKLNLDKPEEETSAAADSTASDESSVAESADSTTTSE